MDQSRFGGMTCATSYRTQRGIQRSDPWKCFWSNMFWWNFDMVWYSMSDYLCSEIFTHIASVFVREKNLFIKVSFQCSLMCALTLTWDFKCIMSNEEKPIGQKDTPWNSAYTKWSRFLIYRSIFRKSKGLFPCLKVTKVKNLFFFNANSDNDFESYTIHRQIKFAAELSLDV
jgi:hypothetical protein